MQKTAKIGAIVLAAGEGKRMQSKSVNKVTSTLGGKPLILHTVSLLESLNIASVIIVVGFAKESVISLLTDKKVIFAHQQKRLGTGHALQFGFEKLPDEVTDVVVMGGDDSAFFTKKLVEELLLVHKNTSAVCTFLTINLDNPSGLGRVIRNEKGEVLAIVEERDATDEQKEIHEINSGIFIFSGIFLNEFLPTIEESSITGEYYLVDLVRIAANNNKRIATVTKRNISWRGINTQEELEEAQKLFTQVQTEDAKS